MVLGPIHIVAAACLPDERKEKSDEIHPVRPESFRVV